MFYLFLLIGNFDLIKFFGTQVWGPSSAEHVRTFINPALAGQHANIFFASIVLFLYLYMYFYHLAMNKSCSKHMYTEKA